MGKCPSCGKGAAFNAYLKVCDTCNECGEELSHHRADDFPPYVTIFVVGHIVVAMMLMVERSTDLSHALHLSIWIPMAIIMSLILLQPFKGAVVGMQWALRMHGFGEGDNFSAANDEDRLY